MWRNIGCIDLEMFNYSKLGDRDIETIDRVQF